MQRTLSHNDPRAVLVAYAGPRSGLAMMPMGGWATDDPDALRAAVLAELECVNGERGPYPPESWAVRIEPGPYRP